MNTNPPTPTIEGLDEIFETLVHGLNNNPDTSNYIGADGEDWGHIRNAKAALTLLITKAELELVNGLIEATLQTWHTGSPFANIENINANTISATSNSLLTKKAQLEVQLKATTQKEGN